ncbi:MAG: FKBP-type peptidyl-prolyl cis-trans isomerase [Alistipes sp.]|nr:FKBP-type peptidyl-prolyl cis-trans isomerase [Alistipes sp.]
MKLIRNIATIAVVVVALLISGCSNDTDTVLTSQQTGIERYLTGSHQPRLIVEDDIGNSLDDEPQFYTRWGMNIYRYIATYYAEGRDGRDEVRKGSTIEIVYTAYIFNNAAPTITNMFATNDAESLAKLEEMGLDADYEWTTEPMRVKIGADELLSGLETALKGCREGDSVEVYLTYEAAYGKHYVGKVPSKSSVVWFVDIVNVE